MYSNTGPFIANTVPPGISALFLNNVEAFLDQIVSNIVADSHITASGTGNLTVPGTLGVTGASTFTGQSTHNGNIVANGGMNANTIRDNNTGATVLNFATPSTTSGTSGTITTGTPVWGPGLKILVFFFNGYINNAVPTITLPSAITVGWFTSGSFGDALANIQPFNGASAVTVGIITGFGAAGAGGTTASTTTIQRFSSGVFSSAIDRFKIGTTVAAATGVFFLVGI